MIEFFKDMYDDLRMANFYNGYMIASTILGVTLDISIFILSLVVLFADPESISGSLHTWAVSDYKFVAWLLIASFFIAWILMISYISLTNEMKDDYNKRSKFYDIAANVLFYLHQCFSGTFFILMPLVIIGSIAINFGNIIAYCTKSVTHLVERIVNRKTIHNSMNKAVSDATKDTFNDFNEFLNPHNYNYIRQYERSKYR